MMTRLVYTIVTANILFMRTTYFLLTPQFHYWAASISELLIDSTAGEAFSQQLASIKKIQEK